MDIVFLADHLVRGGSERQLARIAATLKRRGWKVGIITMLESHEFVDYLKAEEIPLYECSSATYLHKLPPFLMTFRMIFKLIQWRPSVLVTFNYFGDITGRICGRIAGVRAIISSLRTAYVKTPMRERIYRHTECLIDITASNSHAGINYMTSRRILTPMKTVVIPNGIEAADFPCAASREEARAEFSFPPDAFVWLAVGNLRAAKDYPTLLAASEACAAANGRFRLIVAGDGDELMPSLLATVDRLGLRGKVDFLGVRMDIPRLLRACDAFVLSSAWEGMPNTVMEAMASGVPVVSTNAGGVRELLVEGECGFIVPTGEPKALAERMIALMAMGQAERQGLGEAGRARIARYFDNEPVADRWETLILQMIRATSGGPRRVGPVVSLEAERERPGTLPAPGFILSLELDLGWTGEAHGAAQGRVEAILQERASVPAILALCRRYQVKATWAVAGMALFETKTELLAGLPELRPPYGPARWNPYQVLPEVGVDEQADPCHFGLSLVRQILEYEGMELGCHTFSGNWCLDPGADRASLKADLAAWGEAADRFADRPISLVFPWNQFNRESLQVAAESGFKVFRGNPFSWMNRDFGEGVRAPWLDGYFDLTGDHGFFAREFLDTGLVNCPSSFFPRPAPPGRSFLGGMRLRRIQKAMAAAARKGESCHLGWRLREFGADLPGNLALFEELLRFHVVLRERHGVVARTMGETCRS